MVKLKAIEPLLLLYCSKEILKHSDNNNMLDGKLEEKLLNIADSIAVLKYQPIVGFLMVSMIGSGVLHEKAAEVITIVADRDSEKKEKVLNMFVGLIGGLYGNVYTDWLRNNYEYVTRHSLGVARYMREHRKDTNFIQPRQEAIVYMQTLVEIKSEKEL